MAKFFLTKKLAICCIRATSLPRRFKEKKMAKNEKVVADPHACTLDKIISLCKRRGFVYQASEIYGGQAGAWDYGPLGVDFKRNIQNAWWK